MAIVEIISINFIVLDINKAIFISQMVKIIMPEHQLLCEKEIEVKKDDFYEMDRFVLLLVVTY